MNKNNTMKKQKILQINHSYAAPFLDMSNQYASLFDENFEVTSLFLKGEETDFVKNNAISDNIIFFESKTKDLRGLKLKIIFKIVKLIKENDFNLIIAHRYKSIYVACFARFLAKSISPIIGVTHAYNVYKSKMRQKFISFFRKNLHIIGVSKAIKNDISKHLTRYNFENIYSLPNCIKVKELQESQFSKSDARKHLNLNNDDYIMATAGRIHAEKDQKTLISAFAKIANKIPKAKLIIYGKGKIEKELSKQIELLNMQEKIIMAGFVNSIPKYYAAFDLFVLPSTIEPFGMVLIEAMAAKVPVISSDSGGGVEVVAEEDLLFEIGDIDTLASKLEIAYNWSNEKREGYINYATDRLNSYYSQESFNKKFWNFPINF